MASGNAPIKTTYEEFEPFCKWQKEEGVDTLEVHLQGFKKEELRVQLNSLGVMRINGERWVAEHKRTKFQKEITVPNDVKTNEIRAKLSDGILYITMPKHTPLTQQIILPPHSQENEAKNPKMATETVPKKTGKHELDGKENGVGKEKNSHGSEENEFVLKLQMTRKMAVCVTGTFAVLVAIGVFLMYFKKSDFKM